MGEEAEIEKQSELVRQAKEARNEFFDEKHLPDFRAILRKLSSPVREFYLRRMGQEHPQPKRKRAKRLHV